MLVVSEGLPMNDRKALHVLNNAIRFVKVVLAELQPIYSSSNTWANNRCWPPSRWAVAFGIATIVLERDYAVVSIEHGHLWWLAR